MHLIIKSLLTNNKSAFKHNIDLLIMENPNFINPKQAGTPASSDSTMIQTALDSIKDLKSIEKFLPASIDDKSINLSQIAEMIKKKPTFDFTPVVEMAKNLKTLDPTKHSQIESILTSKTTDLSNNTVADLVKSLSEAIPKSESKYDEIHSNASGSYDDTISDRSIIERKDGKNLVESVKENVDKLLEKSAGKKKVLKKRWWTPEEVRVLSTFNLL